MLTGLQFAPLPEDKVFQTLRINRENQTFLKAIALDVKVKQNKKKLSKPQRLLIRRFGNKKTFDSLSKRKVFTEVSLGQTADCGNKRFGYEATGLRSFRYLPRLKYLLNQEAFASCRSSSELRRPQQPFSQVWGDSVTSTFQTNLSPLQMSFFRWNRDFLLNTSNLFEEIPAQWSTFSFLSAG